MFGRKVEDMRMAWIAQECPALHTLAQVLGDKGHLAPLSHHTADVQAPVGVEIIHHPVVTVHGWQLRDDIGQMGGGNRYWCRSGPEPALTRRYNKRGNQCPCAMPNVLVLTFFRFCPVQEAARGIFAQESASRLFIAAEDQTALLKEP